MCRDWGGTLFMPDNNQEVQLISDYLRYGITWLGATDLESEGLIKWDDGEECCIFFSFEMKKDAKIVKTLTLM